jgi:hypothetical protein
MEHIDVPAILAYRAGEVFATLSGCRPDGLETSLQRSALLLSLSTVYAFGLPLADNTFQERRSLIKSELKLGSYRLVLVLHTNP